MNEESLVSVLREQVERLYRMDFYKNKLDQARIRPSDIRSMEDFRKVPFTHSPEFIEELLKEPSNCSLYSEDVTRVNFSPSGSQLYPVYQTNADIKRMNEVSARSFEAAGVKKSDLCAVTFGYHLFIAGIFYQTQLEYYGAKVIPLGPGESERARKIINHYRVSVLISNPTFAMKLAAADGIPSVRILFVGGEPFTSVDGYADRVRATFGRDLTIIDSYGMAACSPLARSCRYGTGLHVMDDFVFAEVIDPETGENVPYGEKGELVITHLYKEAAPLLRYRTGDLTIMERKECKCGRDITLPKGVFGRTDEMLKVKGVKFWPSQVGTILSTFPECSNRYRVVVSCRKGVDVLELVVEGSNAMRDRIDELSVRLKQETLIAFNTITVVPNLEQGPIMVDKRKGNQDISFI
nr:phenylacetate--CoA ligase family protein [Desulfobacterales bacterium]